MRPLREQAEDLRDRAKMDLREAFVDGSFSEGKKGDLLRAMIAAEKAAAS